MVTLSPFYSHDGFTDNHNQVIIKPGSRPLSKFNYDPSVLCEDNPSPPQCKGWRRQESIHHIRMPAYFGFSFSFFLEHHVPCQNFYNQSDGLPLWWQALQQEADFYPMHVELYLDNDYACQNHTLCHFYIHNRSYAAQKKYSVEWQRGARLRNTNENSPRIINLCYTDNQTPASSYAIQQMLGYSFQECLLYYGKLADLVLQSVAAE